MVMDFIYKVLWVISMLCMVLAIVTGHYQMATLLGVIAIILLLVKNENMQEK